MSGKFLKQHYRATLIVCDLHCTVGLNTVWCVPSPCLVFEPLSAFHTETWPLSGSFSRAMSTHLSFWDSSWALNPKCNDKTHQTVLWSTSGLFFGWGYWSCHLWTVSFGVLLDKLSFLCKEYFSWLSKFYVLEQIKSRIFVLQVPLNAFLERG